MRLYAGVGALLAAALSLAAAPRWAAPDVAMCSALAAQVRSNPVIAGGGDALATLSKGSQPYIQLAGPGEIPAGLGSDAFTASFGKLYRPSERLAAVLPRQLMGRRDVYALPATPLHMLETTEGTANCAGFLFFAWTRGGRADLLPGLPAKAVHDGDNLICDGFHDDGWLARVGGRAAFLDVTSMTGFEDWQVTPWRADSHSWGAACEMEARFAITYAVEATYGGSSQMSSAQRASPAGNRSPASERPTEATQATSGRATVPAGSAVAAASLRRVAPEVVSRYEAAKDPSTLTFGKPVQGADLAAIRALRERLPDNIGAGIEFPGFALEATNLADIASYPLLLDGHAYLMVVGHPHWGWRSAPGTYVILYAANAAPLQAAAAAYVTSARGPLRLVNARPWEVR
ncbi:MAG TPA: hypothetical protein VN515_04030 [Terriglobales bacterium]|nr:hypothetical protein [Terriglobales bacterium]